MREWYIGVRFSNTKARGPEFANALVSDSLESEARVVIPDMIVYGPMQTELGFRAWAMLTEGDRYGHRTEADRLADLCGRLAAAQKG